MAIERLNYSFKKGCGKVAREMYPALQHEIMEFLGCKTRQHYYNKRLSFPNMPAHVKSGIEEIFSKYGVDPEEVWNITTIEK